MYQLIRNETEYIEQNNQMLIKYELSNRWSSTFGWNIKYIIWWCKEQQLVKREYNNNNGIINISCPNKFIYRLYINVVVPSHGSSHRVFPLCEYLLILRRVTRFKLFLSFADGKQLGFVFPHTWNATGKNIPIRLHLTQTHTHTPYSNSSWNSSF